MRRVLDFLHRASVAASAFALAVVAAVVAFQIIGRYVPAIPRALWTEEIARMGLLWLVFLGAAAAVRTSEHYVIDLIPDRLSATAKRILVSVGLFAILLVGVALLVGSIPFVKTGTTRVSTTLGASLVYSYVAPLVAAVLIIVFTLEVWVDAMRSDDPRGMRSRDVEMAMEAAEMDDHAVALHDDRTAGSPKDGGESR